MKEKSPLKKYLLLLAGLTIIIFIIFLFIFRPSPEAQIDCRQDQYSGETICSTNYESESSAEATTTFLGLSFLDEHGFSNSQQDSILSTLKTYFASYETVSYQSGSFDYESGPNDSTDFNKSFFTLISNTAESFRVHLDTHGSISSISVSVEKI